MRALAPMLRNPCRSIFGRRGAIGGFSPLRKAAILVLGVAVAAWPGLAGAQNATFKIPPVKIPLKIKEQTVTITASGVVSVRAKDQGTSVFNLQLDAALSEL